MVYDEKSTNESIINIRNFSKETLIFWGFLFLLKYYRIKDGIYLI